VIRTIALSAAAALAVAGSVGTAGAFPATGGGTSPIAEARALLDLAPVLSGETRSTTSPVKILDHSPQLAEYLHLVQRKRYWTVDESWKAAYRDLTGSVPSGLTSEGSGRLGGRSPKDRLRYTVYGADPLPTGIAYAVLVIAVAPDGHDKAAIGVYAQAVRQPARHANEIVPTSGTHAHVAVHTRFGHLIRGKTVTGSALTTLIDDFNALKVDPGEAIACPADFRNDIVTFHFDGNTMVATTGVCGLIVVTRNGHQLPALSGDDAFFRDVHHDLAPASHSHHRKRPGTERVPLTIRRATWSAAI
jgi:hypothetical protein